MNTNNNKNVFLARGGGLSGKGLLVIGGGDAFIAAYEEGVKSRKNNALFTLRGQRGVIRKNKAGTCFVLDLTRGGETICVGTAGEICSTTEELNTLTREGSSWWCKTTNGGGCDSIWIVASDKIADKIAAFKKAAEDAAAQAAAMPRTTITSRGGGVQFRGYVIHGQATFKGHATPEEIEQLESQGHSVTLLGIAP